MSTTTTRTRRGRLRAFGLLTVAMAALMALVLSAAPANATQLVSGANLASFTVQTLRTVPTDDCSTPVQFTVHVDFNAVQAALSARGYYLESGHPISTAIEFAASGQITGPAGSNYYWQDSFGSNSSPNDTSTEQLEICPDDFNGDVVHTGTFSVTGTIYIGSYYDEICHAQDGSDCFNYNTDASNSFAQVPFTTTFRLVGQGSCSKATAKVKKLAAKVKHAKHAKKKRLKAKLKKAKQAKRLAC